MKHIILQICIHLLFGLTSNGQDLPVDTQFSAKRIDIKNTNWGLRVCNGIQNSYFLDVGISRDDFVGSPHGFYSDALFIAFSTFPSFNKNISTVYGVKAGAEFWGSGMGLALEMGYFKNNIAADFLITPKIGIGISQANVVYGYGFSTNKNAISRIGSHTISLQFNIPLKTIDKLKKKNNEHN